MKSLVKYITEGLQSKYKKWFTDVYNTQQELIKDNKIQPIQIDISKLTCPPNTKFSYEDFASDVIVKKIVGDKQVGFTVINQMLRNPKQYLLDENKELNPECIPFWYAEDKKHIYFAGIVIYDNNVSYIDNFIHLIAIETSLIVAESTPVLKEMLKQFIKKMEGEKQQFIGITAKPTHPKMKAILIKLGFNSFKDNKEILTYKL